MLELTVEWLSWAQVAGGHLPTSVFELERMLVRGLRCTQEQVRLAPCNLDEQLVLYPLLNCHPVEIHQDRCDMIPDPCTCYHTRRDVTFVAWPPCHQAGQRAWRCSGPNAT